MDEKLARGLVAAGLDSLAFSFAGVTAADQDPLRGAGTFERAIQAAETFARSRGKSGRPPSLMNFLLLRSNGRQLGQAARLARRLGMARLQVGHLVQPVAPAQQSLLAYPNFKLPLGYLFGLRLATLWRRVEVVLPSLKSQPTPICPKNPLNQAFVGADGSVSPCVYLTPLFAYRCRA
jgi:MoaA/NifB/PqqE/SkfB family radical SAM enzyme